MEGLVRRLTRLIAYRPHERYVLRYIAFCSTLVVAAGISVHAISSEVPAGALIGIAVMVLLLWLWSERSIREANERSYLKGQRDALVQILLQVEELRATHPHREVIPERDTHDCPTGGGTGERGGGAASA